MIKIIEGFEIEISKKLVKRMNLSVALGGKVKLTIPFYATEASIIDFIQSRKVWLGKAIERMRQMHPQVHNEVVSGEKHMIFGKECELCIISSTEKTIAMVENKILMKFPYASTTDEREKFFDNWRKKILSDYLVKSVERYKVLTNFTCASWRIREVKSLWGSYSHNTKIISFNLRLVEKPYRCIDYVVLHELAHSVEGNHAESFKKLLDQFMPNWREVQDELLEKKRK